MNNTNAAAKRDEHQDRFAELETEDGIFIYDRQNHTAWVQCTESVLVTEMR